MGSLVDDLSVTLVRDGRDGGSYSPFNIEAKSESSWDEMVEELSDSLSGGVKNGLVKGFKTPEGLCLTSNGCIVHFCSPGLSQITDSVLEPELDR